MGLQVWSIMLAVLVSVSWATEDISTTTEGHTTAVAGTTAADAATTEQPSETAMLMGCRAAGGLCCQGKNNTCRALGRRLNSVTADDEQAEKKKLESGDQTCFCDSACLDILDCCLDYKETCAPVDCQLADNWEEWGECDVRCGTGIKQRIRRVVQPALNGGRQCEGNTVEKAVCEGTSCKVARAPDGFEELSETGKIIPATYGAWRKDKAYNPYEDIRKNLYEHYGNQTADNGPSYCMQFEITDVKSTCRKLSTEKDWTWQLVRGAELCVECQALAMRRRLGGRCRGHGVLNKETRWAAVAAVAGCHGKWTMKSRQDGCQCAADSPLSFILV
jgi:hypothetical protein